MDVVDRADDRVKVDDLVKADVRAAKADDRDDRVAKLADDLSDRKVAGTDPNVRVATMSESDSSN